MGIGVVAPVGSVELVIRKKDDWVPDVLAERMKAWSPRSGLGQAVRDLIKYLPDVPEARLMAAELIERVSRCLVVESELAIAINRLGGQREDYGVVSRKVVTTAGVGFLVDAWQNIVEFEIMKYHGLGTSAAAEATGNTALGTELTTQYNPDNTRATGSLTEGASANIFKTVGTITVDANVTVEEHGIFSQAATGGGTLWDRSLTGSKALLNGESIDATYQATFTAGG